MKIETMSNLVREIYELIVEDVVECSLVEKIDLRGWEKENRERIESSIRQLLIDIAQRLSVR